MAEEVFKPLPRDATNLAEPEAYKELPRNLEGLQDSATPIEEEVETYQELPRNMPSLSVTPDPNYTDVNESGGVEGSKISNEEYWALEIGEQGRNHMPREKAKNIKFWSKEHDIPEEELEVKYDEYKEILSTETIDINKVSKHHPELAEFILEGRANAAHVREDQGYWERFSLYLGWLGDKWDAGTTTVRLGELGARGMKNNGFTDEDQAEIGKLQGEMAVTEELYKTHFAGDTVGEVAQQASLMASVVGSQLDTFFERTHEYMKTGFSPHHAFIMAGGQFARSGIEKTYEMESGHAFIEYHNMELEGKTLSIEEAKYLAQMVGAINASFEYIGLFGGLPPVTGLIRLFTTRALQKKIRAKVLRDFGKTLAVGAALEGATEGTQHMVSYTLGRVALLKNEGKIDEDIGLTSPSKYSELIDIMFNPESLEELKENIKAGIQGGGGMAVTSNAPKVIYNNAKYKEGIRNGFILEKMNQDAEANVEAGTVLGEFARIHGKGQGHKTLYIDAAALEEILDGAGKDKKQVLEDLGISLESFEQDKKEGVQIGIPLETYVEKIAPDASVNNKILMEVSVGEGAESVASAIELDNIQREEAAEEIKTEVAKIQKSKVETIANLKKGMGESLIPGATADRLSEVMSTFFDSMFLKYGVRPEQIIGEDNIVVEKYRDQVAAAVQNALKKATEDLPNPDITNLTNETLLYKERADKTKGELVEQAAATEDPTEKKSLLKAINKIDGITDKLPTKEEFGKKLVPDLKEEATGQKANFRVSKNNLAIEIFNGHSEKDIMEQMGKLFFHLMEKMHKDPNTPPELLQSINEMMEEVKGDDAKFATMFIDYFNGKKPEKGGSKLFEVARQWTQAAYKEKIANKGEKSTVVSPEFKDLMDRMFAVDEDVDYAKNIVRSKGLFLPFLEGLTPKQRESWKKALDRADDSLVRRTILRYIKHKEKREGIAYRKKRRELKAQIKAEILSEDGYRIAQKLRLGKGLSEEYILREHGPDVLKLLNKKGEKKYYQKGGIDPLFLATDENYKGKDPEDMTMELADEMILDMATQNTLEEEIKKRFKEREQAVLGDLLFDREKAVEEAMENINQKDELEVMYEELKIMASGSFGKYLKLKNLVNKRIATPDAVMHSAKRAIEGLKVGELEVALKKFKDEVYRSNKETSRQLDKGNLEQAIAAKQKAMHNLALLKEGEATLKTNDKGVKFLKSFAKKGGMTKMIKAGPMYSNFFKSMLTRLGFVSEKHAGEIAANIKRAKKDRKNMYRAGVDGDPDLNITRVQDYKTLEIWDFQHIVDTARTMHHIGNQKYIDLQSSEEARRAVEARQIVDQIAFRHKKKDPGLPSVEEMKDYYRSFFYTLRKFEFVTDSISAMLSKYTYRRINAAQTEKSLKIESLDEVMNEIYRRYGSRKNGWAASIIQVKGVVNPLTGKERFSKLELIMIALNMGAFENKRGLMEGNGFTHEDLVKLINQLDKKDMEFVSDIWGVLDSYWDEIDQLDRRSVGKAPVKVKAVPVETRFGTFSGGYFPMAYDKDSLFVPPTPPKQKDREVYHHANEQTNKYHLYERSSTASPNKLEVNDFAVLSNHLTNVIHDLTHREAVWAAQEVMADPHVLEAIRGVDKKAIPLINEMLDKIAGQKSVKKNYVEKTVSLLARNATTFMLGWKATTVVLQTGGLIITAGAIGPAAVLRGMQQLVYHEGGILGGMKQAMEKSPELRLRRKNFDLDINRVLIDKHIPKGLLPLMEKVAREMGFHAGVKAGVPQVGKYTGMAFGSMINFTSKRHRQLVETAFWWIGFVDTQVATVTWLGAYSKAMQGDVNGMKGGDDKASIEYADHIVRTTQGNGQLKDLSAAQLSPILKPIMMFQHFFSTLYNIHVNSGKASPIFGDGTLTYYEALSRFMYIGVLAPLYDNWLSGKFDDGDGDEVDPLYTGIKSIALYPISSIPILNAFVNGFEYGQYKVSPAFEAFFQAKRGKDAYWEWLFEGTKWKDLKPAERKAIVNLTALSLGLPLSQVGLWVGAEDDASLYQQIIRKIPEHKESFMEEKFKEITGRD
jgi:hypothetical protein